MQQTREELIDARWSQETVHHYMERFGTVVACNYVPAYCYNYMQLWYDFREETIVRELDWAKEIGINSLRMFLPLFAYQQGGQWETVKERVRRFFVLAEERGMSIMMTFQPNYMYVEKQDEPYQPYVNFRPGRHINHWDYPNSAFGQLSEHPELMPVVFAFMKDIMEEYAADARVIAWDLWNETWPEDRGCLEQMFAFARTLHCTQPLTACWEAFEISDIITFHNYVQPGRATRYPQKGSLDFLPELERALSFGRPILCTECLARSEGNTFESFLPFFAEHQIGFYFWGLCAGSAQYHYPWDWPEGAPEPKDWFHCILYPDGTPYRDAEIRLLQQFRFR